MKLGLRAALAAGAFAVAVGAPRTAHAQLSSDAALIGQLIVQEQQAVTQLKAIVQALAGQTQLIMQMLKGQPQGEIDAIAGLLASSQANYQTLIGNLQTIGYTIQSVNGDYSNTFPNGSQYTPMSTGQMQSVTAGWQSEILASAEIAARAQTSISDTQHLNDLAAQLLQMTGTADSEVGQLQLVTEMLGVLQAQMTMLVTNLSTTGRALVEGNAAGASERTMSTEHKRRNRLNYTSRGASVNVPSQMP
jgi:conjugal transfer/entry exclusion protein